MKRILSIIICVALLCPCVSFAHANAETESEVTVECYVSYANSIIPDLMNLPGEELPTIGLFISQPVEIHGENHENTRAIFMFEQNTCIGILLISYVEDNFYASFIRCEVPAISSAYVNSTPFYLIASNGTLIMCASATEIIMGGTEEKEQALSALAQNQAEELDMCVQRDVLSLTLISPALSSRSSGLPYSSETLDVPFVANTTVNGKGLCWAAGAASIIRYLKNNTTVSALDVYNAVSTSGPPPTGSAQNVLRGLYYYGVQNYLTDNNAISFVDFTKQIDAGYPVLLAIIGTAYTLPSYHGVVVCGYLCESDGTNYMQILDSNVPEGKIWITVNGNTNTFIYNANFATTYTSWAWSVFAYIEE